MFEGRLGSGGSGGGGGLNCGGAATTAGPPTESANVKSLEDSMAKRSSSESIITLTCRGSRP